MRSPLTGLIGVRAEGHAGLLAVRGEPLDLGLAAGLRRRRPRRASRCSGAVSVAHQRVLGREDHERGAEQRVRTGREHAQLLAARVVAGRCGAEDDLGALGAADPVGLHEPDRLGPVDAREVEQLVRVLRDAEEPLLEVALDDRRAAAPADPVGALDLLARQHDLVLGAPVDRRHLAIGQARPRGSAGRATGSSGSSRAGR